ncbi:hypothetical protein GF386_06770 [Candidatus Pacearchaeota archaeon]|nr:hypothetical protein [Candidatus Pacearchaeota archaeon]MBD3283789.1 hypothetical protein [Candidatus Pacearchaeota archaeon]
MEILKDLGLTKYESLIYATILKYNRINAKLISEYSGVPITAVYPNLKTLIKKRLIQELKGDVSLFEALPPDIAIDSLIREKQKNFQELKEKAVREAEDLLNRGVVEGKKEVVLLTYGKPASAEFYLKSINRTKKSYYVLGWKFVKISDKYNFLKGLQKLIKKKIDVRIILTGPIEKNWELIKDYQEAGIKIRYLPLSNFSIFVRDAKECKITLKDKKLPERFNIQILDESLAKAMHFYFLENWEHAKELNYDKKLNGIIMKSK